jgi:hypothetical protein
MSMKDNQYSDASPSGKKVGRKVSLTESPGTYGKNPDPGWDQYPQSRGPNTIPVKFGENPNFRRTPNPMETQIKRGTASKPTTTKLNNSKNRYENTVKKGVGKI